LATGPGRIDPVTMQRLTRLLPIYPHPPLCDLNFITHCILPRNYHLKNIYAELISATQAGHIILFEFLITQIRACHFKHTKLNMKTLVVIFPMVGEELWIGIEF
jgi:hypothetical protein